MHRSRCTSNNLKQYSTYTCTHTFSTVCGCSCICNMLMDMVIWYDKCVWYHNCSITCQKRATRKNAFYLGQLCQPFIRRTQINCVQVSGSLRQMDVADKCLWSTIRLGWLPREFKLHVMLLLCMCSNHHVHYYTFIHLPHSFTHMIPKFNDCM